MYKEKVVTDPKTGQKYVQKFGKYGEIVEIAEYRMPKTSLLQTVRDYKPATKLREYIQKNHPDNFLLKSALVQAPLAGAIALGFGRRKKSSQTRQHGRKVIRLSPSGMSLQSKQVS
jgi:hypothetical protein